MTELEIRKKFLMIPLERGGLNPINFGQESEVSESGESDFHHARCVRQCMGAVLKIGTRGERF
jgi:hypothetical protein